MGETNEETARQASTVIVLGAKQMLGVAISESFTRAGYLVQEDPMIRVDRAILDQEPVYAVALVPPVLVYDYGDSRPRSYRAGVDVFDHKDPRGRGEIVGPRAKLGDVDVRRYVEAVAGPGARIVIVSPSLTLDPDPKTWLEDVFEPDELPLLIHTEIVIVDQRLIDQVPDVWSVGALPSGSRDGRGLGSVVAVHEGRESRDEIVHAMGAGLVERLESLRVAPNGLVAGEVPF